MTMVHGVILGIQLATFVMQVRTWIILRDIKELMGPVQNMQNFGGQDD